MAAMAGEEARPHAGKAGRVCTSRTSTAAPLGPRGTRARTPRSCPAGSCGLAPSGSCRTSERTACPTVHWSHGAGSLSHLASLLAWPVAADAK